MQQQILNLISDYLKCGIRLIFDVSFYRTIYINRFGHFHIIYPEKMHLKEKSR